MSRSPRLTGLSARHRIRNEPGISSNYGSMLYTMDKEIGRIMAKLDDPDGNPKSDDSIRDDTLVVFINDNGGANNNGTSNAPLRNWKGSPYEGGVRVPMIVAGAGVTAAPGSVYDRPVHSIDLLPTFYEAGGGAPIPEIDGVNLLPFVNGEDAGVPHGFLTMRAGPEVGMRMGDWKLVKNGRGAGFELFDLSLDLSETNDVSALHPEIVDAMVAELTRFEARAEKPRHHGLNSGANSINLNDRFRLDPSAGAGGGGFAPDQVIVGPSTLNGGFEDNDGPPGSILTFDQVAGWTNLAGNNSETCARDNLAPATGGPWNGVGSDAGTRLFALDTGYTIAAGDRFLIGYDWRDASGWADGSDRMRVSLFTTSDGTLTGARTDFFAASSGLSAANSSYQTESHVTPVVDAGVVGGRLFIAIEGANGGGSGTGFARFDNVNLATAIEAGDAEVELNWSSAGVWVDAGTGLADTLLDQDSFPGAVLEFPVAEDFSYTATNDMRRPTGLDFMLNKIVFSGTRASVQVASGLIDGLPLLFTNDLDGQPPAIEVGASGAFPFTIENDLVLLDGLEIRGSGAVGLTLAGSISEFEGARGISKSGAFPLLIQGAHSYTGATEILDGGFTLFGNLQTSNLTIAEPAEFHADGAVSGDLDLSGTMGWFVEGSAFNHLTVAGHVSLDGATLNVLGPVILPNSGPLSYGSLSGSFSEVTGLPDGHSVDYGYDEGSGLRRIAIVPTTPYLVWAQTISGLEGAESVFDHDANDDGVPNGVAFFLGATDANIDARPLLPSLAIEGGGAEFSYDRATGTGIEARVRYSADLSSWDTAIDGVDGVTRTVVGDRETVRVPLDLADGGRLHLRLEVSRSGGF